MCYKNDTELNQIYGSGLGKSSVKMLDRSFGKGLLEQTVKRSISKKNLQEGVLEIAQPFFFRSHWFTHSSKYSKATRFVTYQESTFNNSFQLIEREFLNYQSKPFKDS